MNIFEKLINWLIVKLGGYTEEEYAYVMDKWSESLEINEKLYEIEEYWRDKYEAEHENYLAMLSLHNTTVEQMQTNSMGVAGAIDTIKAYCDGKDGCDNCALYDANKGCKIAMCPCYWG